jgi:menaquinol-cytochrome c reductase iron-sulfur subunit
MEGANGAIGAKHGLTAGAESGSDTRRKFVTRLTGAVVGLGSLLASWPLLRSLVPNVLYEPPQRFGIGQPERFQQGVTFLDQHRLYLFREGNGFFAISGICTHLGCTVKFAPFTRAQEVVVGKQAFMALGEFHCPCHGSKFHGDGRNFAGPAPRPLKWHPLEISAANGDLVVDLSSEVDSEFRLVV